MHRKDQSAGGRIIGDGAAGAFTCVTENADRACPYHALNVTVQRSFEYVNRAAAIHLSNSGGFSLLRAASNAARWMIAVPCFA